jgi:hypothetical protein
MPDGKGSQETSVYKTVLSVAAGNGLCRPHAKHHHRTTTSQHETRKQRKVQVESPSRHVVLLSERHIMLSARAVFLLASTLCSAFAAGFLLAPVSSDADVALPALSGAQ